MLLRFLNSSNSKLIFSFEFEGYTHHACYIGIGSEKLPFYAIDIKTRDIAGRNVDPIMNLLAKISGRPLDN